LKVPIYRGGWGLTKGRGGCGSAWHLEKRNERRKRKKKPARIGCVVLTQGGGRSKHHKNTNTVKKGEQVGKKGTKDSRDRLRT